MTSPARNNGKIEERMPMIQFVLENRNELDYAVLVRKLVKNCGAVFLIILMCGTVAYGLTLVVWYLFKNDTSTKNSSTTTNSATSYIQYGIYVLVFLFGALVASAMATILWYFLEKKFWRPGRSTAQPDTRSTPVPLNTSKETVSLKSSIKLRKSHPPTPPRPKLSKIVAPSDNFALSDFRIVGFYDGYSSQDVRESQLQKLTHIIFSAIDITAKGAISFQSYGIRKKFSDLVEKSRRVNPALRIIVSIGNYVSADKLESVAANSEYRRAFSESIVTFVRTNDIDGIDLFWHGPSEIEHRSFYVLLLQEIREQLTDIQTKNSYLLTVIMPNIVNWQSYKNTLDLNGILEYVDFMNIQTVYYYGFFHTSWGAYTGPSSPLYSGLGAFEDSNVDWTMTYFKQETEKPNQLNMGVPFHGIHWRNVEGPIDDKEEMWFSAKPKTSGQTDFDGGFLPWRDLEKNGWDLSSATWHQESRTPFIYDSEKREFLGFENEQSLNEKIKYAKDHGIGGITIQSLEMDDDIDTLLKSLVNSLC